MTEESERQSYIRKVWRTMKHPFDVLWDWANNRNKLERFRSLQKWAHTKQESATTPRAREKWKTKYWQYKSKADSLEAPDVPPTGTGTWGGSRSIIDQEVIPFVQSRTGAPVTSTKRSWGSWGSDHNVVQVLAYAADFGVGEAHGLADDLGRHLGIGPIVDYASYYIFRSGRRFRVQIIAGTHGTGPHLHVGIRRA